MIYVASRRKNAAILRAHRDCGVPIISTWMDAINSGRTTKPTQEEIWRNSFDEIGKCTAFILHDGGDGALIELGIALGMGVEKMIATDAGPWTHISVVQFAPSIFAAYEMATATTSRP